MPPKLSLELIQRAFRFFHPEKLYFNMSWPAPRNVDNVAASFYGVPALLYRSVRRQVERQAWDAARQLLNDPALAAQVDALPFLPGQLVAAVGDSLTDDLLSWFHILQNLVTLRRPRDMVRFLNAGFSSDTTTHILCRFSPVARARPDWIFWLVGINDARRHGERPGKTAVSLAETARNLDELALFAESQTPARQVWLTPAPILAEQAAQDENLRRNQFSWQTADLDAVSELVRRRPAPVLDLYPLFGIPPAAELLMADGLHPSLAGQTRIARALVEMLSK